MKRKLKFFLGLLGVILILTACPSTSTPDSADAPSIEGLVWQDSNTNNIQDTGETGLADRTVYLDTNNNAALDTGEPSVKTDAQGNYKFTKLEPGDYIVRQVLPFGSRNVTGGDPEPAALQSISYYSVDSGLKFKQPHIVGGVDADINSFPFMAAVGFEIQDDDGNKSFSQFCGGVLISDSWVLTAAHCSLNDDETAAADPIANNYRVMIGDANVSGENGKVIPISNIVLHPSFDLELNVNGGFDAALWELSEKVNLKDKVFTVDMLDKTNEALANEGVLATAVGWGTLSSGGPSPDILQVVHVPVFNSAQCQAVQPDSTNFETQICAGVPEGGIDSCQGDSGGPLFVKNSAGDAWQHAGITSYGNGCAFAGEPGVYARTSVLSDWIKTTASLSSKSYKLTLSKDSISKDINFGNIASTRVFKQSIAERWQTTNLTPTVENPAPNALVTYNWRIIDEGTNSFTCVIDLDGPGPAKETVAACKEGENSFTSPAGYAEGVYLPELSVSESDAQTQSRQIPLVVGKPVSATETGALAITDPTDPNYEDKYFIDYYALDLTGIPENTAILLSLDTEISSYLALYDPEDFSKAEGGPEINSGFDQLIFVTDGSTSYIVGVSSFDPETVGVYTFTTSSGTLTVF